MAERAGKHMQTFRVGQRVRVPAKMIEIALRSRNGTIARRDQLDGVYWVRLDKPALYHPFGIGNGGPSEEVSEIRVAGYELNAPRPSARVSRLRQVAPVTP